MEKIIEKNKCTGCTACLNICPNKAIEFIEDEEGFKYPKIIQDKCINCGLCKKTCPILNYEKRFHLKSYACYNKNIEERLNSSSGGIFILLAKYILKNGGVVFGAAFDQQNNLYHVKVDNMNDVKSLMGSKYLQSDLKGIFAKVKEDLKQQKKVLFTGTPCQVEGLKRFLKKD